jgi:hypothetical protein
MRKNVWKALTAWSVIRDPWSVIYIVVSSPPDIEDNGREIESRQDIIVAFLILNEWLKKGKRRNKNRSNSMRWPCVYRGSQVSEQEPILRLLNLQLQRQHCSRLERFYKVEEFFFVFKTHYATYSKRCEFLQRSRCNTQSWSLEPILRLLNLQLHTTSAL